MHPVTAESLQESLKNRIKSSRCWLGLQISHLSSASSLLWMCRKSSQIHEAPPRKPAVLKRSAAYVKVCCACQQRIWKLHVWKSIMKLASRTTTCGFWISPVQAFTERQQFPQHSPQRIYFHVIWMNLLTSPVDGVEYSGYVKKKSGMYTHINKNQNVLLKNNSTKCKWCKWPCLVGKWEENVAHIIVNRSDRSRNYSPKATGTSLFLLLHPAGVAGKKQLFKMKDCELLDIDINSVSPSQAGIICIVKHFAF